MKRSIRDVVPGERPSALWACEVKDAATHDHIGMGFSSADEQVLGIETDDELLLYQLTGEPELDDDWREYKATAKRLVLRFCTVDGDGHVTGAGTSPGDGKERYYFDEDAKEETIWFFDGARDDASEPAGPPAAHEDDRVWTTLVMGIRVVLPCTNTYPRFYIGTTTGAVTAGTGFHVSGLKATDGGSVPDPDHTGPDTWDVENTEAGGDGYDIDSGKVGKIIGYADGTLHPLDFPCPV